MTLAHAVSVTVSKPLTAPDESVLLAPNQDGWSLLTTDGRLLHEELGQPSTRACLEFARTAGMLVVRS